MRKYHTVTKRLFAGIIDGVLLGSLSYGLSEIFDITTRTGWTLSQFIAQAASIFYPVFFIGKYGQTLGKLAMGVKVFQLDERSVIGYKRAFFREAVPITANLVVLALYCINMPPGDWRFVSDIAEVTGLGWFILEITTMLTNPKRRAIHDLLASSVVVDIDEQQREIKTQGNIP